MSVDELERMTAAADWDDNGAEAIPASVWTSVRRVLATYDSTGRLGVPSVAPASDGEVHINWRHNGYIYVITISEAGATYSSTDPDAVLGFTS